MSITVTIEQLNDTFKENAQYQPPIVNVERLETIQTIPPQIGSGSIRRIELCGGLSLRMFQLTYGDLTIELPESQHPVQFMVHLSGVMDSGEFPYLDRHRSYIGGSGIQKPVTSFHPASETIGVDIEFQPQLFRQFFALPNGELPIELQPIVKDNDWQQVFSTKTTTQMRSIVQEIITCPLEGTVKRMYLQGKVFELMALQIGEMVPRDRSSLKPETIVQIHYAAEILRSQLEHPPDQTSLAQLVGVSDRTLRRGFQAIFGMTIWEYLTTQRLLQAEQLLSAGGWSIAQVGSQIGYTNQGHFAAAFKRKFGITPKQYLAGHKSI